VVICLELGANLHMAQLMPLPLTVSCSSKIQIGFTFLVVLPFLYRLTRVAPEKRAVKRVCVCVCVCVANSECGDEGAACATAVDCSSEGRTGKDHPGHECWSQECRSKGCRSCSSSSKA